MSKIYLPIEVNSNQCPVMVSDGHIRVYDKIPNGTNQSNVHYYDFYIRDDYIKNEGYTDFSYYTNYNCMNTDDFTTDIWYRTDIYKSLIMFIIVGGIGIYLPYRMIRRIFGRWLKL